MFPDEEIFAKIPNFKSKCLQPISFEKPQILWTTARREKSCCEPLLGLLVAQKCYPTILVPIYSEIFHHWNQDSIRVSNFQIFKFKNPSQNDFRHFLFNNPSKIESNELSRSILLRLYRKFTSYWPQFDPWWPVDGTKYDWTCFTETIQRFG